MKTTEQYISEAKKVHGNFYLYDKTVYVGSKKKICITCPIHGYFYQEANSHLKGSGCPKCWAEKDKTKMTFEKFVKEAKKIFGEKYSYDKKEYKGFYTPMDITCQIHGKFKQSPSHHLKSKGCPKCSHDKKYNKEEFIEKAKKIHGDKYDYTKVEYISRNDEVCIICPKHGEFHQTPLAHLNGRGCLKCGLRSDTETFIEKAKKIHGDKYDYTKATYETASTKLNIICPKHGFFKIRPNDHLAGQGCPLCGNENKGAKRRLTKEKILERFQNIYGNKYSYDKWVTKNKNIEDKIPIICPKHGIFYKTIHQHQSGQGCPKCQSSILENSIRDFLKINNINFEEQKTFDWLKYEQLMKLDFYLPEYNIAIECQGEQHYKPFNFFGGEEKLLYQQKRDEKKRKLCESHNIKILYFGNHKYEQNVITKKNELLKKIKNE